MFEGWNWIFFLTLALIGASAVDDLRARKVHNSLVLAIFFISLWAMFLSSGGPSFIVPVFSSFLAAFAFCLPFYLLRILGGGDFKLLLAISPLLTWNEVGWTLAYSLVWGAVLGVVMVILRKEFKSFVSNLTSFALRNPVNRDKLHKIPYTIAILFGFLTQVTLAQKGVSLL